MRVQSQFIEMTTRSELNKKSIGEIAEVRTGSTPSRSNPEYWNGTHYWVSAQDMGNKYIYDTLEKITDKGYATCKVVPAGSILYVCRGSIGVMSINTMDCATNQSICTATCKTGYNTEYLYYALKVAEKAIKKQGIGTSFKSLNQSAFASIEILFPAIEIQDKFATIAKQADKSKFVGFKSQFIEMFGNPVTNSKSWQTKAIMEVAPEQPSKKRMQGKVWLLNLDMIESNTGKVIEKVYETSENTLSVQPFDEGNVLFSKLRPYLNKVVVPDEYGLATTELVPLRPNQEKLHKVFLSYLLRSQQFVTFANKISGGTKMPRMPLAELRKFECILPPMSEQLKFVGITEQADKSKYYN